MKKIITLLLSTAFVVSAFAQQTKPKQTYLVLGSKNANLEIVEANGVSLKHRAWGPEEERKFSVRAYANISTDKWTTVKFKLKYTGHTPIYFVFGGEGQSNGEKKVRDCVLYDNVKINGTLIQDGDFEKAKLDWKFGQHPEMPARAVPISADIRFGNNGIGGRAGLANSQSRISTELNIKKDEVFEVSFEALAVPMEKFGDGDIHLNIRKYTNMAFADENAGDGIGGWMDEGKKKSFRKFKSKIGKTSFEGVSFNIIDPEKNSGSSVMTFQSPRTHTILRSALFDFSKEKILSNYLYFLHSLSKNQNTYDNEIFGYVVVIYNDGTRVPHILRYAFDCADCWEPSHPRNAKVVYRTSKKRNRGALYMSRVKLDPEKFIKSIEFSSAAKMPWVVVGATMSLKNVRTCDTTTPTGNPDWVATDMPKDLTVIKGSALDFSAFWDGKPACYYGRAIVSERGTMTFEKTPEKDVRFKGYTFYPLELIKKFDKETAHKNIEKHAKLVRMSGYNLVRINFDWIKSNLHRDKRAEQYDYIDYIFSELKKNGVYVHLPLAWYDIGTKDYHFLKRNDVKIRAIFGEKEARSMWKETAEEQLNHYNPYTKMKWKDDPVFQVFEYYNELNICYNKFNELEPKTKELVLKRWRAWLEKKYGTIDKLNDVWNKSHWGRGANYKSFAEVPEKYSGFDWEHFMQDVNDEFMEFCRQTVRGTGYKGLVVQRNLGRTYRDLWTRQKISDVIITNSYYQHPVGIYTPGADHTCGQTSSIANELGYWRTLATTKNFDRPLTTTEYNHCYWNKYRYEMMSVFPSYSAFQNFSTLVIHSDAIDWREKTKRLWAFNVSDSPAIRCSELFNQCFFMRGDVKVSNNRVDMLVSEKLAKSDEGAYGMSGGQMRLPLITGFAVKCDSPISESLKHVKTKKASLEVVPNGSAEIVTMGWFQTVVDNNSGNFNIDKFVGVMKEKGLLPKNNLSSPKDGIYHTDTGQIYIDSKKKFAKTVTDFSCVATVDKSEEVDMGALKLLKTSVPASVGVASLDGKKISESSRLIFVYSTQEDNMDAVRSYDNSLSIKGGMGPIVMKRGKVRAELKLDASKKYAVYPIALNGERREKLDMEFENGVMQINIDNGKLKNGAVAMFEIVAE